MKGIVGRQIKALKWMRFFVIFRLYSSSRADGMIMDVGAKLCGVIEWVVFNTFFVLCGDGTVTAECCRCFFSWSVG